MAIETLQWVYQLSDFDTSGTNITPPDEQGAQAQGSPPFNITLDAGAGFQQIELEDGSDDGFDEVNGNSSDQLLTQPITLDGVTYPAGTRIFVNYGLETDDGFRLYSITIGGNNSGGNDTTAVITNGPLVPGQQYTFTSEFNIGQNEVPYSEVACFVAGTRIATARGQVPVEKLEAGDLVLTVGGREVPLRLSLCTEVSERVLEAHPRLRPIRLSSGSLGRTLPTSDLYVSRQHRMLISSKVAERMFGRSSVLVAAAKLALLPGIEEAPIVGPVKYFHLVFDAHEVIFAEGAPSESLLTGGAALDAMPEEQREEIFALFPELEDDAGAVRSAWEIPIRQRQKKLVERHAKNGVAALQTFSG